MPKLLFRIGAIKCAFWEWMPKQQFFAVDFGSTEETREETINYMWKRFAEVLQSVERSD